MTDSTTETRGFQAEVSQLLKLMIHSMYSHREIFLRELISNASDACDKLRFAALAEPALASQAPEIRIDFDAQARTLSVSDTGIGMGREDAALHLGTIAKSGTAEFFALLTGEERQDSQLIGQFGVGFYSAFIVADRVEVTSRRAGSSPDEGVRWSSAGDGEFTLETVELAEPGTTVLLQLKEAAAEFADAFRLRSLIRKYSDHIAFPVLLRADGGKGEYDRVNQAQALWTRPKAELTDEDYQQFYRHVSHDPGEPLAWSHHRVEGRREYTTLLYLPSHAPFDLYNHEAPRGLKLYVRRVFILDDAEQFLPRYLRFIKGVVDSADLPLNVSRELLQQDDDVQAIRSAISRRVLDMLERLASEDAGRYRDFWREFGSVLKEGLVEDPANAERIAGLLRFASTAQEDDAQTVSLADYQSRLQPGQSKIYFVMADTATAARGSPLLEGLQGRKVEVLLLSDRVDPWIAGQLPPQGELGWCDVARDALALDSLPAVADAPQAASAAEGLFKLASERLAGRYAGVRASERLSESAACLVRAGQDPGPQLRQILKAAGQEMPELKPWLELNAAHPLVLHLGGLRGQDFDEWLELLADEALLAEGGQLADPAGFVRRLNRMLLKASASES